MAHRIVKKTHKQHQQGQETHGGTANCYVSQGNESEGIRQIQRPILPSVNTIYTHDKNSHKQNRYAFPPAESLFVSQNTYDAGPNFLRPTSAVTFGNPRKSNFPLGVWITPFGYGKVSRIKVGFPLRCSRCRAYANCYFRFDGNKTSAICNICTMNFNIEQQLIQKCNINNTQLMTQGVVDYILQQKSSEKKNTNIIKIIIAIQIHSFLMESASFSTILSSIKSSIQNIQFQKNIRIGILIYTSTNIIYLKLNRQQNWHEKLPTKYIVKYGNLGLCCPLSDVEMLFDPKKDQQQLLYLLTCITSIAEQYISNKHNSTHGANYAIVLKTILQNFDQDIGRVLLFASTAPRSGPLSLRSRNQQDNKNPLKPLTLDYFQLSKQLITQSIGVDLYIITKEVLVSEQLATTHFIATHTGGRVHLYSPYNPQQSTEDLYYNIYGSLQRKYVYNVHFTARFSNGLNLVNFGIGDGIHEIRDITLGMFDPANSVTANYQHEQKIQENNAAFVQFAMLFTNGDGENIIRVINYRFQISNKIQAIHQACDYLAVANVLMRQSISKIIRGDVLKVRQQLINKLVGIIAEYAQQGDNRTKHSQFLAHRNIIPAFSYLHSFVNSRIFLNYLKYSTDQRMNQILKVSSGDFLAFANTFYPKLFSLGMEIYQGNPCPGDLIEGNDDIQQSVVLPPTLPLTGDSLSKSGVYLCWFSDILLFLIQPQSQSSLLTQIFGTSDWQQLQSQKSLPQLQQSSHNIRINLILDQLRRRTSKSNGIYLSIMVITPKNKNCYHQWLGKILLEDYRECKFYSFMDSIHREVQGKLK